MHMAEFGTLQRKLLRWVGRTLKKAQSAISDLREMQEVQGRDRLSTVSVAEAAALAQVTGTEPKAPPLGYRIASAPGTRPKINPVSHIRSKSDHQGSLIVVADAEKELGAVQQTLAQMRV